MLVSDLFAGLPAHPLNHRYVRDGSLIVWLVWELNRQQTEAERPNSFTISECVSGLSRLVLGQGDGRVDDMPARYTRALDSICRVSLAGALENQLLSVAKGGTEVNRQYALSVKAKATWNHEAFPGKTLSAIRRGFLRRGLSTCSRLKDVRKRAILRHLASHPERTQHSEDAIRMGLGTEARLASVLRSLRPFVFVRETEEMFPCYDLNELGMELWNAIRGEFFSPMPSVAGDAHGAEAGELLLYARSRTAAVDPTDQDVFRSVVSIVTGLPVDTYDDQLFSYLGRVTKKRLSADWFGLCHLRLVRYRSRLTGATDSGDAAHWIELTTEGRLHLAETFISETLLGSLRSFYRAKLQKLLEDNPIEHWHAIMSFARSRKRSWSEQNLRQHLGADAYLAPHIRRLYPLIAPDECYYGAGHRYKLSEFGEEFMASTAMV